MKALFTSFLILTVGFAGFAQVKNLTGVSNSVVMKEKYRTTEGSPYLYDDWKPGTVTDIDGRKIDAVLLKYDSYQDKLSIFKDGQELILNEMMYPGFSISFFEGTDEFTRNFIHSRTIGAAGLKGYYESLHEGDYRLIRKFKTDYINNVVSDYGTTKEIEKFITNDFLILVKPDGSVVEVKGSKNAVFAALGESEDEARNIAKKQKLNVKKEEDLSAILSALETQMTN